MANAARKARKREGIRFEKAAKIGTPLRERSWFKDLVVGPNGTRFAGVRRGRSEKKLAQALAAREGGQE